MNQIISVIVPVYNVEKYIKRCIESIINQSYKELEIILVDDGSTDASGRICDEFLNLDQRIKVIHKKNGGLSDARNCGIEAATGGYIAFIDSDDYIEPTMFETLIRNLVEFDADISACGYDMIYTGSVKNISEGSSIIRYSTADAFKVLLHKNNMGIIAWNKLYKKKLLQVIRFPINKHFEDINTTYKIISKANFIVYDPKPLYHYIQRNSSINGQNFKNSIFNEKIYDMEQAADELLEYVINRQKLAIKEVSIGCCDYYMRIINHEIEFNIKNDTLREKAKRIVRNNILNICLAKYLEKKKKIQMILFGYCFTLYKLVVKGRRLIK